jgi:hypothetical protein
MLTKHARELWARALAEVTAANVERNDRLKAILKGARKS